MPPSVDTTESDARAFPVDQSGEIELALDGRAFLDIEPVDLLAVRAGLVGHGVEPSRRSASFFTSSTDFTTLTPAGLAAAAGVDLRLHHQHRQRGSRAAFTASSTVKAACPRGTGTPNSRSTALA